MSSIRFSANFEGTATEIFDAADAPAVAGNSQMVHSGFNRSVGQLTASSTPPVSIASYIVLTGTGGTIDLSALATAIGNQSCNGKKLRYIRVYNPNATGNFVIGTGGGDGYTIPSLTVGPGCVAAIYLADTLAAVVTGASDELDWTGTAAHTYQLTLIFG